LAAKQWVTWMWLNGLERCASSTATGPQNATVAAFSNDIKSKASRSDVIGRAIACTTWIVEPNIHDLLASVGAVGELIIEGPILARGYLDDPEKTDLAFVYPKWLAEDTSGEIQRVYKTEDLVRYDSDGSIVYLGRKDTQVKLHGQRVEIGEIENHLWSHPLVKNALVLLANIHPRVPGLVAGVTLHGDANPDIDGTHLRLVEQGITTKNVNQVRNDLSTQLPTHMIPTVWLAVEELPFLPSGKLDRKSVAQWIANMGRNVSSHNALRSAQQEPQHPRSPIGYKFRQMITQVLRVDADQLQTDLSFSSIGGDSIAAMGAQSRCRDKGIKIRCQDIVKSNSICRNYANGEP